MFSNGSNNGPAQYAALNTTDGTFKVRPAGVENAPVTPWKQLRDVTLRSIKIVDDSYNGKPLKKCRAVFAEAGMTTILEFNLATYTAAVLLAMMNKADVSKPFGITLEFVPAGTSYKRKDETMSEPSAVSSTRPSLYQSGAWVNLTNEERPPKAETLEAKDGKGVVVSSVRHTGERVNFAIDMVATIAAKLKPGSAAEDEALADKVNAAAKAAANEDMDIPF